MHESGFLWFKRYDYTTYLQALDRRTGEQRWRDPIDGGYGGSYVANDVVLYVAYPTDAGDTATALVALSAADGTERWRTSLSQPTIYAGSLPVLDDMAFLGSVDGTIHAIDLADGSTRWSTVVGARSAGTETADGTSLTIDGNPTLAATSLTLDGDRLLTLDPTGGVVELDAATGAVVATHPAAVALPSKVWDGRLFVTADRLVTVVTGSNQDASSTSAPVDDARSRIAVEGNTPEAGPRSGSVVNVTAVDRATGAQVWTTSATGSTGVVAAADGRLVLWTYDDSTPDVATSDMPGRLAVLDLETGTELWAAPRPFSAELIASDEATISDGQLLLGTQAGDVVSLDLATGAERWRYRVGDQLMTPPSVSGGIAVTSDGPDRLVAIALPEDDKAT